MNPDVSNDRIQTDSQAGQLSEDKVVLHRSDGSIVKGYLCARAGQDLSDLLARAEQAAGEDLTIRQLDESMVTVPLCEVKSVFFVKSFRGDSRRKGLRFYSNGPSVGGIWAEIQFKDNEIIEGTIDNSVRHLLGNGFLLHPSDSESNNLLIYVNKSEIASFRALGIKATR